ncbi:hypothetical protein ACPCSF_14800 [Streptomyces griseoincarnatus]
MAQEERNPVYDLIRQLYALPEMQMSEPFAGAMVTVIPIIMLVAGVEYTKHTKRHTAELDRELSERRAGVADPVSAFNPRKVLTVIAVIGWGTLAGTHIVAEGLLILWLASVEQEPQPGLALFISVTAYFGFAGTIAAPAAWYAIEGYQKRVELARLRRAAAAEDGGRRGPEPQASTSASEEPAA